MSIMYISICIFLLMSKISANSPTLYFDKFMTGVNTTEYETIYKGLFMQILVDLVLIRYVVSIKVGFVSKEVHKKVKITPIDIAGVDMIETIPGYEYPPGTITKTIGGYVRFIKLHGSVNITDVQIDMGEIPRIEYYVGCFRVRKLVKRDKYRKTVEGAFSVNRCRLECKDFELYGINSDKRCICIMDIAGLTNVVPRNCEQICNDTYGFCGGKNLFSVYAKSHQLKNVSTSNPWNCFMVNKTSCQTCEKGYQGYDCNIRDCLDLDICGESKKCRPPTFYNNMNVQFGICICTIGYSIDNNFECQDIDECEIIDSCPSASTCNNTMGSYNCTCNEGYEKIRYSCADIDECFDGRFCDLKSTECHNYPGTYVCKCQSGFHPLHVNVLPAYCDDHDECEHDTPCGITYICNNTIGSYLCTCRWGFEDRFGYCGDIDECYGGLFCDLESTVCLNQPGSYSCYCRYGFERFSSRLPAQCYDIDECLRSQHDCDKNTSYCFNKPGSFICECHRGYKRRNRFRCEDINECTEFSHGCGKASECINSLGSYECKCPAGSIANVFNYAVECQDTNECEIPNTCNITISICLNIPFTYICQCFPGYINVDNFTCRRAPTSEPIDEFDKTLTTTEEEDWFTATTTPSAFDESLDFFQDFGSLIIIAAFIVAALAYVLVMLMRRASSRSGTLSTLTTVDVDY